MVMRGIERKQPGRILPKEEFKSKKKIKDQISPLPTNPEPKRFPSSRTNSYKSANTKSEPYSKKEYTRTSMDSGEADASTHDCTFPVSKRLKKQQTVEIGGRDKHDKHDKQDNHNKHTFYLERINPEYVVEEGDVDYPDYPLCIVCSCIPTAPKICCSCESLICTGCIKDNLNHCPIGTCEEKYTSRKQPLDVDIHILRTLHLLKFECEMEGCKRKGLGFEEYIAHFPICSGFKMQREERFQSNVIGGMDTEAVVCRYPYIGEEGEIEGFPEPMTIPMGVGDLVRGVVMKDIKGEGEGGVNIPGTPGTPGNIADTPHTPETPIPAPWKQGFFFGYRSSKGINWGLRQLSHGPCGVLAAVQGYIMKHVMYVMNTHNPSEDDMHSILIASLTDILTKVHSPHGLTCICIPDIATYLDEAPITIHQCLYFQCRGWGQCYELLLNVADEYAKPQGNGVLLLLYSILLTLGTGGIQQLSTVLDTSGDIFISDSACGECLISLLLTGLPFPFDTLTPHAKGIFQKQLSNPELGEVGKGSEIGVLASWCYSPITVSQYLSSPRYPIYLLICTGHYSLFFTKDPRMVEQNPSNTMEHGQIFGHSYDQLGGHFQSHYVRFSAHFTMRDITSGRTDQAEPTLRGKWLNAQLIHANISRPNKL